MEGDAEAVVRVVLEAAKGGDMTAARLVLDRVLPPRKGCPITFDLPPVSTAPDVVRAVGSVLAAVASGALSPDEGALVANLLEHQRKAARSRRSRSEGRRTRKKDGSGMTLQARIRKLEKACGADDDIGLEELISYSYSTQPDAVFEARLARSRIARLFAEVEREAEKHRAERDRLPSA
jgi:hypothetical protein